MPVVQDTHRPAVSQIQQTVNVCVCVCVCVCVRESVCVFASPQHTVLDVVVGRHGFSFPQPLDIGPGAPCCRARELHRPSQGLHLHLGGDAHGEGGYGEGGVVTLVQFGHFETLHSLHEYVFKRSNPCFIQVSLYSFKKVESENSLLR